MKTFIRWNGNKSKHINKFKEFIPEFTGTYIEPFLGSGALFLYLQPEKWIINDLNKDLINIWNNVKTNSEEIIRKFKNFGKYFKPLSKEDKLKACKKLTSKIENMNYDLTRAIIYLSMNNSCYMGIIKKNNIKFSGFDIKTIQTNKFYFLTKKYYNNLKICSEFLNNPNGKIYNKSYEDILTYAKKGDFVFIDPPYIEETDYQFNYNKDESLNNDFIHTLYNEVKKLNNKQVKWMMTQADTKQIREKFNEYTIKSFKVYRYSKKKYVNELIIMNY